MTISTSLDLSKLARMAALLDTNQIAYIRTEEALLCKLSIADTVYAHVYLVPAESFYPSNNADAKFSEDFAAVQERILGPDFYDSNPKNLYLMIVGEKDFLDIKVNLQASSSVEQDLSYGKKEVLTPEQVIAWLTPTFSVLAGEQRANKAPFVAALAEPHVRNQPEDTSSLNVEGLIRHDSEEHRHLTRVRTNSLYRRIMGGDHQVFWDGTIPTLGRVGESEGSDVMYCSSGERIAFAVALYMARSALDVYPGMTLGFYGTFDRLDSVRQIGCYDCLRELVAATGVNVIVQSAKESLRQLAMHRMRPVVEAIGGSLKDYPKTSY